MTIIFTAEFAEIAENVMRGVKRRSNPLFHKVGDCFASLAMTLFILCALCALCGKAV